MAGRTTESAEQESGEPDRAALALTAAGIGEFEWATPAGELWVSPRMAALTGLAAGIMPAEGGPFPSGIVHPDDLPAVTARIEQGLRHGDRFEARFRWIRPDDGRVVWLDCRAAVSEGGHDEGLRLVGVVRDVSAEKGEAEQLEALVAELDHRVKNVLASVQSLAAQSARRTLSLEAFLKTFFGRLQAMAAAHTLLTATRWRGVEISHIAAAELGGLAQGQARWTGPDIVLNPRATHALTLALHELSANAVKFGALSTEAGRIEVTWRVRPDGGFELVWSETNGPIVTQPDRRGFGWTLLERVTARELGGGVSLDFRPDGLRVTLSADKTALAASPSAHPIEPEETSHPSERAPTPGASSGGAAAADIRGVRILIVEDAVLLALELEAGLAERGATVVGAAADLDEAMRMLSLPFDVAVLDANLNGLSVTPVAQALAARRVPFIFATGYGEAGAAPAGFPAPVVRKPYNVRQITAALVEAMGRTVT